MAGVSESRVCDIISLKLRYSKGNTLTDRLIDAFDLISADRESEHKGDVDYAAAEHYLFARALVVAIPPLYPSVVLGNAVYSVIPDALKPRFGNGPTTPSSPESRLWGKRGADDGIRESLDVRKVVPDNPRCCSG